MLVGENKLELERVGLWASKNPEKPWEWRKTKGEAA